MAQGAPWIRQDHGVKTRRRWVAGNPNVLVYFIVALVGPVGTDVPDESTVSRFQVYGNVQAVVRPPVGGINRVRPLREREKIIVASTNTWNRDALLTHDRIDQAQHFRQSLGVTVGISGLNVENQAVPLRMIGLSRPATQTRITEPRGRMAGTPVKQFSESSHIFVWLITTSALVIPLSRM